MKRVYVLHLLSIILLGLGTSCVFKADDVKMIGFDRTSSKGGSSKEEIIISVNDIILEDDQLKISGENLDSVTEIKLQNKELSIVTQNANQLILSSSTLLNLALNTAMDLILTNAYGQSVTSVQFNLVDGAVSTSKLADDSVTTVKILDGAVTSAKLSNMGAGIGQYLKYSATGWVPGDLSSLTYAGNWNASINSPDLSGGGSLGEFYIVSDAGSFDLLGGTGTNSWSVGDWAVWNNVLGQWEKIDNATNVQSFNGRSGPVTAQANDYTWAQIDKSASAIGDIANVDLTGLSTGQILKFDGTNWVASDDLSSGGAGSVSSSEIADGTIVNGDISPSAAIAYSKLNIADGDIAQSKVSGLSTLASSVTTNTSAITSNDTDIAANASNISALSTTVGTKAASTINLTAGNGLSGGGDLSTDRTFSVNVDGTTLEIVSDALQVKTVSDTLLTTACSDNEVLRASSGSFICAASTDIGNWTLNTTDLYYNLGKVGIGTATPTRMLSVVTPNTINAEIMAQRTDGVAIEIQSQPALGNLQVWGANPLTLSTNSVERMRITDSGDIGIGTSSPATKLEVNGTVTATAFSGDGSALTNVDASSADTVTANAGLVSSPSISFSGDSDTGFYQASSGSNSIDISVGGANIFNMNSSGIVSATSGGAIVGTASGSAAVPTFSFNGDSDTGWYSGGTNILAAATGGSERIRIDASGNIGMGTTTASEKLDVNGNIIANKIISRNPAKEEFVKNVFSTDAYDFTAGASAEGLVITFDFDNTGGNPLEFGLDENNFYRLSLEGDNEMTIRKYISGVQTILSNNSHTFGTRLYGFKGHVRIANNTIYWTVIKNDGTRETVSGAVDTSNLPLGSFYLRTGSSLRNLKIIDGGYESITGEDILVADHVNQRIGIGTTTPNSTLEISHVNDPVILLTDYDAAVGDKHSFLSFRDGLMKFGTTDDSYVGDTHMVIDNTGYVGINTTSPTRELDVNGTIRADDIMIDGKSQTVKQLMWSRIVDLNNTGVQGTAFFVNISGTRSNVVWNSTWLVNTSHAAGGSITALSSSYYTQARMRLVVDSNGGGFLEFYDEGSGAVSGTNQAINITIRNLLGTSEILTAYQDGTDTTGYTVKAEVTSLGEGISVQGGANFGDYVTVKGTLNTGDYGLFVLSSGTMSTGGKFIWATSPSLSAKGLSHSSGDITITNSGVFKIDFDINVNSGTAGQATICMYVNGVSKQCSEQYQSSWTTWHKVNGSMMYKFAAGDVIYFQFTSAGDFTFTTTELWSRLMINKVGGP